MNLLDRWEKLLEPFGFSTRFVKWSFLTVVSSLLENRCFMFDNGGGYLYPTLYTLLVGAPATFKTTTCDRAVEDLLFPIIDDANGPWFGANISTPAGLIQTLQRHGGKNIPNDFKSSPCFIYSGEWQQFYADIGGGTFLRDLLGFYDPKPPGRVITKELVKDGGPKDIVSPALTILGCTTIKGLIDTKMMSQAASGIVSRFIFVHEPGRPKGCTYFPTIRDNKELKALQASLIVIRSFKGPFIRTLEADRVFAKKLSYNFRWNQANPTETLFAHYMARRSTQLKKLAMIFSAISRRTMVIEPEDIEAADALLLEIEPDMPQAFGLQTMRHDASFMSKILDKIDPEGTSETEVFRRFVDDGQLIPKGTEYYDAIAGLVALRWILKVDNKKTGEVIYKKVSGPNGNKTTNNSV